MKRLLGSHARKVKVASAEEEDARTHCKTDTLLFLLRACCLLAALCVSIAVPVVMRALVNTQSGHCPYAMSIKHTEARTREVASTSSTPSAPLPALEYNGSTALHCMYPMYTGVSGSILAFLLLVVCLYNLRHATFRSSPSLMAKVQVALVIAVTLAWIGVAALLTQDLASVCENTTDLPLPPSSSSSSSSTHTHGHTHSFGLFPSYAACRARLSSGSPSPSPSPSSSPSPSLSLPRCEGCTEDMFDNLFSDMWNTRNMAWAAAVSWAVVSVLAVARYYRAHTRAREIAAIIAQQEDLEECKAAERRREILKKEEEANEAKKGKGFLDKLLM